MFVRGQKKSQMGIFHIQKSAVEIFNATEAIIVTHRYKNYPVLKRRFFLQNVKIKHMKIRNALAFDSEFCHLMVVVDL